MGFVSLRQTLVVGLALLAPVLRAEGLAPVEVARLDCTVDVREAAVACVPSGDAQVTLTGRTVRQPGGVWSVAFDVRNTSTFAMGVAADGTADPAGVEVQLAGAVRTSRGTGVVARRGAEGVRVVGRIEPGAQSSLPALHFQVPAGVEAFALPVAVLATIAPPRGWLSVSPASISVFAPGTASITASARAVTGVRLPGSATFSTGDASVATVDASGTVTGVGPGSTSVTVQSGSATASVAVAVCPDLAVGGVYHTTLASGESVCVGGYTGAEYTILPINPSTSSSLSVTLTGTGIQGVTGPPSPRVAASPLGNDTDDLTTDREAHLADLERSRQQLAGLSVDGTAQARTIPAGIPSVGDLWTLNVARGCSGTVDNRTGTVRVVRNHVIIVSDNDNPAGGFNAADYDTIAEEFDVLAWPAVTDAFGTPTDVDGNERIVLFYTRAVNELSPPASASVTYSYFESRDLYSAATCTRSNEGEILYMLVPDPTGVVNSNVRTVSSVRGQTIRTAGHELQHLVNASRRLYVAGASTLEETWLDEGLSDAAEELMFYKVTGLPGGTYSTGGSGNSITYAKESGTPRTPINPRENINLSTLTSGTNASWRVYSFNAYANYNYGRLKSFYQRPDLSHPLYGPVGGNTSAELGNRGALWAFLRYAADRRGGDENTFWAAFGNSTTTGAATLQAALGLASEAELQTWTRDWVVAVYADDAVSGVAATYTQPSWNYRSVYGGLGGFPLTVTPLSNATPFTRTLTAGGSTWYFRAGVPASGTATFQLSAPTATAPVSVSVLRTK